jgi:hypothetical protein
LRLPYRLQNCPDTQAYIAFSSFLVAFQDKTHFMGYHSIRMGAPFSYSYLRFRISFGKASCFFTFVTLLSAGQHQQIVTRYGRGFAMSLQAIYESIHYHEQ